MDEIYGASFRCNAQMNVRQRLRPVANVGFRFAPISETSRSIGYFLSRNEDMNGAA